MLSLNSYNFYNHCCYHFFIFLIFTHHTAAAQVRRADSCSRPPPLPPATRLPPDSCSTAPATLFCPRPLLVTFRPPALVRGVHVPLRSAQCSVYACPFTAAPFCSLDPPRWPPSVRVPIAAQRPCVCPLYATPLCPPAWYPCVYVPHPTPLRPASPAFLCLCAPRVAPVPECSRGAPAACHPCVPMPHTPVFVCTTCRPCARVTPHPPRRPFVPTA